MSLKIHLNADFIVGGYGQNSGFVEGWKRSTKFEIQFFIGGGAIYMEAPGTKEIEELLQFSIDDIRIIPFIKRFEYSIKTKQAIPLGRYQFGKAKGRAFTESHGNETVIFIGSTSLADLKELVRKITDNEIRPGKVSYEYAEWVAVDCKCFFQKLYIQAKSKFSKIFGTR